MTTHRLAPTRPLRMGTQVGIRLGEVTLAFRKR